MIKRLFIGIPLHSAVAGAEVKKWAKDATINQNRISWIPPENWHVTLYFLGDTPSEAIPILEQAIDQAFSNFGKFDAEISGLGVFPNQRNPKVMWFGVDNLNPMLPAWQKLGESLRAQGFEFDQKPFKPHLTVARIRNINNLQAIREIQDIYSGVCFDKVVIDRVVLFESILSQTGPVYKPLSTLKFKS